MKFGFGENDKLGKIDFDKLISGLSKNDLHIIDDFKKSLFDSIDTDNSGTLSKDEISIFEGKIKDLAGDDGILSVDEAGLFKLGEKQLKDMETFEEGRVDSDGNALLHQKINNFFSFLETLSSKTEGIKWVNHKSDCQVIKYENGIEEIQYTNGRIVIKENNEVIYDSEAKVTEEKTTNVTDPEFYMINYLKDQIKTAKYIIETADDNTSITGALVDWWCRLDILWMENNHPLDKMDKVIEELERNVLALEKAAKNSPEEYNRVCKEKFGIDFNAAAVEEFMVQANEYELISQQHAIYDIVCHPENYRGGHGHAAADQVASYRENAENFLLVCDAMGYSKEDIQAIIDQAVEQFNKTNPEHPYEYAHMGSLENPDNKYFMAQRKGGGYDVDWGPLAGYAFDILRDKVEADLNTLYETDSFEEFYKQKTDDYNSQLKKVLGVTNVVDDATEASEEYQDDVASLNNAFMMITMVATLASGGLGILANFMKGVGCVARCTSALNTCNNIIRITSGVNKYLSVAATIAATNPIGFVDQLLSENGMTAEAFASWGKNVLQNGIFMGLGMCASNFAMRFASWYKAGQLATVCKKGGQTFDDLMDAVKSSPQNFPPDLVKSLKSINRTSMMLQISAETLMDFGFSAAGGYTMMGDDYEMGSMDFWMSLAFSINGGFNEKIMRDLNTQNAKIEYINKALEEMRSKSPDEQNSILNDFRRENNIDMDNAKLREQFKDFKLDKEEITKMVAEDDNFKAYTLARMIYGKDGCILQKELSVLSNDAKAKYVQDALRDFNLSYEDAWRVVEYMDAIAKREKIEQGKQLDDLGVIHKKLPTRSVSEEISRLAKVEEIDLPTRVRGLDDGTVKENSAPEAQTTTRKKTDVPVVKDLPVIDGLVPKYTTDEEALAIAKRIGLTDAEFKDLKAEYPQINSVLEVFYTLMENDIHKEEFLKDLKSITPEQFETMPYINKLNIEEMAKRGINNDKVFDTIFEKVYLFDLKKNNPEYTEFIDYLSSLTKINYRGDTVSRFDSSKIKDILNSYKVNSELTIKLIDATKKDRFGKEVPRFSADDIEKIIAVYKENPELTEKLIDVTIKDYFGNDVPRFTGSDIIEIVAASKENLELTEKLIDVTIKYSNGNVVPRFDGYDIRDIVAASKENPELTIKLIDATKKDSDGNVVPRFISNDIVNIVTASKENPELTIKLIDATKKDSDGNVVPSFDVFDILNIVTASKENLELTEKLIDATIKDSNGNVVPRFNGYDIRDIVAASKGNSELTERLIDATIKDSNGNVVPRFTGSDIRDIVTASKENLELTEKLIDATIKDSNGNVVPRFNNAYDIRGIVYASIENLELTERLIDATIKDSNGNVVPRFNNGYDIRDIVYASIENLELTEKLIDATIKDYYGNVGPRFTGSEIKSIVTAHKGNSELTERLIDATIKVFNGDVVPRFNGYEISDIVYASKGKSELTERLIDATIKDSNGNEVLKYNGVQIQKILQNTNNDNINLVEIVCFDKNLSNENALKIIDACKINDPNDAGGNNGKIDPKKVERYTRLLQNPKTYDWAINMLDKGFDIETISRLAPTKQNKFSETPNTTPKNSETTSSKNNNSLNAENAEIVEHFSSLGLNDKEISSILKAINKEGVANYKVQQAAIELIQAGIARNKIGDILNSAQITGEYNPQIVKDFVNLQNLGLNPLLEKNLALLKNLSEADVVTKFNSKVKKQLKGMLSALPDDTKTKLSSLGFDLETINKKLDAQIVRTSENVPQKTKVVSGFRSRAKITGFEKIVVEKYGPEEKVWRSEDATRAWAEEKYQDFKSREYVSTRNTSEDPQLAEKVTQKRKEMLEEWYKFMETDEDVKNNPFIKVILCDFITKELDPERSTTPPVFDKTIVKEILSNATNSSNFSFGTAYAKKMKSISEQSSQGKKVEINGRRGTWYSVPQTDKSSPDFKANAAKIRAFSDGTNWCIRTWNAEPYLQQGTMHFFVDENGLTQVCIRENAPGKIAEIQKRQQSAEVPVAYIDFIQDYIGKENLDASNCEGGIKNAIEAKPQYEQIKTTLQGMLARKDYKSILEKMGITVTVLENGTWEISHYTSYINKISLNDFGINENDLLSNVSRITGNASFKDSNATSLPLLEEVGGELDFGYANISNLKNLKRINSKDIDW